MRFFFDENLPLRIAHALALLEEPLGQDAAEVRHLEDMFDRGTPDEIWLPEVGRKGFIIISRDLDIRRTRSQWALQDNAAVDQAHIGGQSLMPNEEHLRILRRGVEEWNGHVRSVRTKKSDWCADLEYSDLQGAQLRGADLKGASLNGSLLIEADLSQANLNYASLVGTDLTKSRLHRTQFYGANLEEATLVEANLSQSKIVVTDLLYADLRLANLTGATMARARITMANLSGVVGAETVRHSMDSSIDFKTIISSWPLPNVFLRGVGLPMQWVQQLPALIGALEPIQFYSCFISHSSKDKVFATRLHKDLDVSGIRTWYSPRDLRIGDDQHARIEEAIRVYDKFLVIISKNSIESSWVKREVLAARERQDKGEQVYFPVMIDDAWETSEIPWVKDIRRSIHIGDFRGSDQDVAVYNGAFERLVRDLRAAAETEWNR